MICLVLTLPFYISSAYAVTDPVATNEAPPLPGEQCEDVVQKGETFLDIMDSGIINTLEIIASIMFAIAQVVNTIDMVLSVIGNITGHSGANWCCRLPPPAGEGVCIGKAAIYTKWKNLKADVPLLDAIVAIGSCACCSGGEGRGAALKATGAASGICGAGFLFDELGGALGGTDDGGVNQFKLSAFDNIYTAVGCLCPTAILFNLRKLKTIYQVRNCCYQEACKEGFSTEVCDQQYDEANCMYWEGALYKT
ncbi:hypothetical protein GOV09_03940, partial [Candidatus Woesearchaeota archaeon]|nr:hypothetical protein [Candidatus Woesearchaeota archaeon]